MINLESSLGMAQISINHNWFQLAMKLMNSSGDDALDLEEACSDFHQNPVIFAYCVRMKKMMA